MEERPRILLVEDDVRASSLIAKGLERSGFEVMSAGDGETGLEMAMGGGFDAAIVDIMLPGLDGLSLIRSLRAGEAQLPVLILSAKGAVGDRVRGLETGADDYLAKPFAFSELLARVKALIRRASGSAERELLRVGDLSLDVRKREVRRNGESIDLPPREYALLEYLVQNAGQVVSKEMIMKEVWDYDFDPQTNVVEARICRLRDRVDRDHEVKLIHTVRGVGYVVKEG